jgi:antitoxin ParD1/3/4
MANTGRNISLTDRHQQFVDSQVATGRHASSSEVVREALRRYEDDVSREKVHLAYLKRLGDLGEAAYQRGEYTTVEREGIADHIRSLGRK